LYLFLLLPMILKQKSILNMHKMQEWGRGKVHMRNVNLSSRRCIHSYKIWKYSCIASKQSLYFNVLLRFCIISHIRFWIKCKREEDERLHMRQENLYDMIWCDMMWYDVIRCDMMRYDVIRCDILWYVAIRFDMMWYDVIRCDMIWYDVIWCDMMRYDGICCDMMWYVVI